MKKRIIILVGGVVLVMVCLLAVVALGRRASNEVTLTFVGRSEVDGFRLVHFELLVPSDRRVFVISKFARRRALVEVGGTQTFTGQPPQFHTDPSGKDLAPDTRVGFSIVEPDLPQWRLEFDVFQLHLGSGSWASKAKRLCRTKRLSTLLDQAITQDRIQSELMSSSLGYEPGDAAESRQIGSTEPV